MKFAGVAVLMMAIGAVPVAAQTTDADAAAKAKVKAAADRKICRTIDVTGSIMNGTRVCHTKVEWASIDQRNGNNVSASRDVAGQGGNHMPGGFNP